MSIMGNFVGSYSSLGQTFIIEDESSNELTGVVVAKEQLFDATDNDVRQGSIYASDHGMSVGQKVIPIYHTTNSSRLIKAGQEFRIPLPTMDLYDYTKIQAIICPYHTSMSQSVAAEKIVLNDNVYPVQSTNIESSLSKDDNNKEIYFGITNNTDIPYVIKYCTYKEVY